MVYVTIRRKILISYGFQSNIMKYLTVNSKSIFVIASKLCLKNYRGVGIIRTGIIRTALELSGQLFALTQYWNYRKVLGKKKIVLPGVLEKANQEIAAALLGYEEHEIAKKSKK